MRAAAASTPSSRSSPGPTDEKMTYVTTGARTVNSSSRGARASRRSSNRRYARMSVLRRGGGEGEEGGFQGGGGDLQAPEAAGAGQREHRGVGVVGGEYDPLAPELHRP